jgi:hypothetical protein
LYLYTALHYTFHFCKNPSEGFSRIFHKGERGPGGWGRHEREFYASFSNILDKMKGAWDGMPLSLSSFTKNFCRIFSPFFSPLCQKTAARYRGTSSRDMTLLDFCDKVHDV